MFNLWWLIYGGMVDPALRRELTDVQRFRIAQHANQQRDKMALPRERLVRAGALMVSAVVSVLAIIFLREWIRVLRGGWAVLAVLVAVQASTLIVLVFLVRPLGRKQMYRALRTQGFDVCLSCGYWLRRLDASIANCPECGSMRPPQSSEAVTP